MTNNNELYTTTVDELTEEALDDFLAEVLEETEAKRETLRLTADPETATTLGEIDPIGPITHSAYKGVRLEESVDAGGIEASFERDGVTFVVGALRVSDEEQVHDLPEGYEEVYEAIRAVDGEFSIVEHSDFNIPRGVYDRSIEVRFSDEESD